MKKNSYLKMAITGFVAGGALLTSGCEDTLSNDDTSETESSSSGEQSSANISSSSTMASSSSQVVSGVTLAQKQAAYRQACLDKASDGYTLSESACEGLNSCKGSLDGETGMLTATCQGTATCKGTLACLCDGEPCKDDAENPGAMAVKALEDGTLTPSSSSQVEVSSEEPVSSSSTPTTGGITLAAKQEAFKKACEDNVAAGFYLATSDCKGLNSCAGSLDGVTGMLTTTCQGSATCKGTLSCLCEEGKDCKDLENPAAKAVEDLINGVSSSSVMSSEEPMSSAEMSSSSMTTGGITLAAKQEAFKMACEENAAAGFYLSTSECKGLNSCAGSLDGVTGMLTTTCQGSATCKGTLSCLCEEGKDCKDLENPAAKAVEDLINGVSSSSVMSSEEPMSSVTMSSVTMSSSSMETPAVTLADKQEAFKMACADNAADGYSLATSDCKGLNSCKGSLGPEGEFTATCQGSGTCKGTLSCLCEGEPCKDDTVNPAVQAVEDLVGGVSSSSTTIPGQMTYEEQVAAYKMACEAGEAKGYVFSVSVCKGHNSCQGSVAPDGSITSCQGLSSCEGTITCICELDKGNDCENDTSNPALNAIGA